MSAPTPWSGPLPLLFTGSFLQRTPGLGNLYVNSYANIGGRGGSVGNSASGTVFDALVNPPSGGITAESFSLATAQAVGTTATSSPVNGKSYYTPAMVANLVQRNFDFVMNFYLEASIARSSGTPIF
jgi:hypothetical protein